MKMLKLLSLLLITVFSFSVASAGVPTIKNRSTVNVQKHTFALQPLSIDQFAEINHIVVDAPRVLCKSNELTTASANATYLAFSPERYKKINPAWQSYPLRKPARHFEIYNRSHHQITQSGFSDYGLITGNIQNSSSLLLIVQWHVFRL